MIVSPLFQNRKYAVLGLGKSGVAAAEALKASGSDVTVWDDNATARADAERKGFVLSDPANMDVTALTALVLSPGVPFTHPAPHPAVALCRKAGTPIIGDIDLLFQACPEAVYLGVTGTNGKSTTTALVGHILKAAQRKVQVGGNLGTPALSLEPLGADGIYTLELSSFQLDLLNANPMRAAVFLNITPDHFDRHGGMDGYIKAKTRIAATASPQTLVLGTDEPETVNLLHALRSRPNLTIKEISVQHQVQNGVMAIEGKIYVCDESKSQPAYVVDQLELPRLPGKHNAQNICAAVAACRALDVPMDKIVEGLRSFPGLAHRQQLVGTIKGVRFINDSKATNADAAAKALACYDNIYWIVGGKPKVGGLNGLESFAPKIAHAFLIGQASDEFAAWCKGKISHTPCGTLDVATQKAAALAWHDGKKDAVVLLSPACASFDQFSGFEERGNAFLSCVRQLENG